jgi:hypothetical protein
MDTERSDAAASIWAVRVAHQRLRKQQTPPGLPALGNSWRNPGWKSQGVIRVPKNGW